MSFEALTLDKEELIVKRGAAIAPYTTFGIGGPADVLAEAYTERALQQVVREAIASRMRWLLIGGGSNLLVGDAGFRGLVIVNRIEHLRVNGNRVVAGAGADLGEVVEAARESSLSGIEFAIDIPGTWGVPSAATRERSAVRWGTSRSAFVSWKARISSTALRRSWVSPTGTAA